MNEWVNEMNETGRSWRGTSCKSRITAAKYRVTNVFESAFVANLKELHKTTQIIKYVTTFYINNVQRNKLSNIRNAKCVGPKSNIRASDIGPNTLLSSQNLRFWKELFPKTVGNIRHSALNNYRNYTVLLCYYMLAVIAHCQSTGF